MRAMHAFVAVAALVMAFNAAIWSGKGGANIAMKLLFTGLAFWGAVIVAKAFL